MGARIFPFDFGSFGLNYRFASSWRHYTQFSPSVFELNKAFVAQARLVQPNVIWVDKGLQLTASAIQAARGWVPETTVVHYNPDDPFGAYGEGLGAMVWRTFIAAIDAYDVHLVAREPNVSEFLAQGAKRVEVFDRSFAPNLHRPMDLTPRDQVKYFANVGFIGAHAPARCKSILSLIDNGIDVAIRGDGWNRAPNWNRISSYWRGPSIYGDEYAKAISGMDIALHFLRRENRDEQDSRTFEIPACGSFMLAERSAAHERLFRDGEEAVFFDDDAELLKKVRYYQQRPIERNRIAKAGRQRCVEDGYDHRTRLLELLARVLKP
jgi:hypothetical protein